MALSLVFILYCIEAGIFFVVAPWTRLWMGNSLLHSSGWLGALVDNPYVRGLVSGFGVIHLIVALQEVLRIYSRQRRPGP